MVVPIVSIISYFKKSLYNYFKFLQEAFFHNKKTLFPIISVPAHI